jgi:adenine-specific DNA-methyltransferase
MENDSNLLTYQIENRRYTGSKAKLAQWIFELISKNCDGESFADLFAGTGVISSEASKTFKELIVNDFLYSNNIIYKGFFDKGKWDKKKLIDVIQSYNKLSVKKIKDNFFSENYGGKYFGKGDAKKIGDIREYIENNRSNFTKKEYNVLIASLIYSADRIANTVGHYDAYIVKGPEEDNRFVYGIIEPIKTDKRFKIFLENANNLARKIKEDVIYIDPPYNSRQYSRFYHVLETLAKWDSPNLYGKALKPQPNLETTSDYCKTNAPNAFSDLIKSLDCKYIVVSYNNTYNPKSNSSKNKITLNQIKTTLRSRGKTKVYKTDYKAFTCGKTNFDRHQELVFITKVE